MKNMNAIVVLLSILVAVAVGFVFRELAFVLPQLVLALFLANVFKPMVSWLRRKGVPLTAGIILALLIVAAILFTLGYVTYMGIDSVVADLPRYTDRLRSLLDKLNTLIDASSRKLYGKPQKIEWDQIMNVSSVTAFVSAGFGSFLSFLGDLLFVLLFMVFLLSEVRMFRIKIQKAWIKDHADRAVTIARKIDQEVREYLVAKIIISAINGVVNAALLLSFGVDFALLSAVLAFLLNFIPNIGTFISMSFPILVVLVQFNSWVTITIILALLFITEFLIGNVLEPRLMGHRLNLSPLVVLVSLIFWGWLWGGWGMILSVPITSSLKIICENIEPLKPVALLMSETPRKRHSENEPPESVHQKKNTIVLADG